MFRRLCFTVYGVAIGVLWAAFLNHRVVANGPVAATIWNVVLAIFFAFCGWRWAVTLKMSSIRLVMVLPWMPFVFLVSLFGLGSFFVIIAVMSPFWAFQYIRTQRRFRNSMKSKGRFIALNDLRPTLDDGTGTLIIEWWLKGPYRIWWTEDDMLSLGKPATTREEIHALYEGQEHPFNSRCLTEYLDEETGKAFSTSIPARWVRSGKLVRMFPSMKSAAVVRGFTSPKKETPDEQEDGSPHQ
jgi:hypothetical protein